MNFNYSEEQSLISDSLGKVLSDGCSQATRRSLIAGDQDHDPEIWSALSELGMLGLPIAEAYAGVGGTAVDTMVAAVEFGRHLSLEPFTASVVLGGGALQLAGTDDQKNAFLPGIADGSKRAAVGFLEPESRFDLSSVATRAEPDGDCYRLSGRKTAVIGAPSADILIVSARTSGHAADPDGLTLFLIRPDASGVVMKPYRFADGRTGADIVLENVPVAASEMLGPKDKAADLIEHIADLGTAALCAEALGALEKIIAMTTEYLKVRTQFGRPIGEFQALQHQLAEMMIDFEHAKSLVFEAAMTADSPEALIRKKAVSAAKVYLGERGRVICQNAIQMHGGIGMTDEYELGDYVKRVMVAEKAFGDTDHHLERYARQMA
ncbi:MULTISPECIES: acyl-CoA dehydrogenase family protein [unclassified Roseibium]|uniref:acyl-CoA dehydrogenase family protein n=1 Tax=unclassified Roseibium TaxID=2629323 RepID=UPI00273F7077|nr:MULTISPECIES: acyl-CoA dehydrogenase family protein [unclassified Roseibium]